MKANLGLPPSSPSLPPVDDREEHKDYNHLTINVQSDVIDDDVVPVFPLTLNELRDYLTLHRDGEVIARGNLNDYIRALTGHPTVVADLSGLHIKNIDLSNIDLSDTYLYQSTLEPTVICNNTLLCRTHCFGTIFQCDLTSADLSRIIANGDTNFSAAQLGTKQERQILHLQELALQHKGVKVISIVTGVAATIGVGISIGTGVGLLPMVVTAMSGAGTSMLTSEIGNQIIDHNVDQHSGILPGKLGNALAEIGAVDSVISGPTTTGMAGLGITVVTKSLPYVPQITGALSIGALGYAAYHGREAIKDMKDGVPAAQIVVNQRPFVESIRADIRDLEQGVVNAGGQVAQVIDNIPFCHKMKNALIFGTSFTLVIGLMITGLALGNIINTDNIPTSSSAIFASIFGTFVASTAVAYCCDKATEAFVRGCGCIISSINCCFTCGRSLNPAEPEHHVVDRPRHRRTATPTNLHSDFVYSDGSPKAGATVKQGPSIPFSHVRSLSRSASNKNLNTGSSVTAVMDSRNDFVEIVL